MAFGMTAIVVYKWLLQSTSVQAVIPRDGNAAGRGGNFPRDRYNVLWYGAAMEIRKPKLPLKDRLNERLEDIAGEPLEDSGFEDEEQEEGLEPQQNIRGPKNLTVRPAHYGAGRFSYLELRVGLKLHIALEYFLRLLGRDDPA